MPFFIGNFFQWNGDMDTQQPPTYPDTAADAFVARLRDRTGDQPEFLQAVRDVAVNVLPVEYANAHFRQAKVLDRLTEPDRTIRFRVVWEDDEGQVQVNRGWRVQVSNALGPYKGGLRFVPGLTESVLNFLGFEQCFKNALTGLTLGGAKGGADFDPRGRSDREVMRFCQAFMAELHRHIGPDRDVPAGDINVGIREIGWLFGAYKRFSNRFEAALTGKDLTYGGSELRAEATGYGAVFFLACMLAERGQDLEGRRIALSGAGNVALHAAEMAMEQGGRVISLSDSQGTLHIKDGLDPGLLQAVRACKGAGRALSTLQAGKTGITWLAGERPWGLEAEIAVPCATQNEMDGDGARAAIAAGVSVVVEGANMPLTRAARDHLRQAGVVHGPGKAANAGGVAVSGFEIGQNATGMPKTRRDLCRDLERTMAAIHGRCLEEAGDGPVPDYARGADIAGYRKLAAAISALGVL